MRRPHLDPHYFDWVVGTTVYLTALAAATAILIGIALLIEWAL